MPTTPALPPPAVADRDALLTALGKTGILPPARLTKALAVPSGPSAGDAAAALVAAGFLTRFQADRLLAGRTDGFVIEPYVIQDEIGRGPGGRVFKAVHRTMNRTVAVKVLAAGRTRTPEAREAFRREARAAAKLNHPNIVTAFDANERGDRAYVVTEYVDGPDLAQLVKERGPLPPAEACEIVRQAAVALAYAREEGMAHRGVKPGNLLVARASKTLPGCVVKVADFGLARLPAADTPVDGTTPAPPAATTDFTAPEGAGDHRSDLYSLGCVLYFLLTGRPPLAAVPVERFRPDVPPAVAAVVHRLTAADPNARFQSAAALAARLDNLAAGAVAVDDDGGVVAFELPPAAVPSGAYHPGYLTGMHPRPPIPAPATGRHPPPADTLPDPSPWAALTEEVKPKRGRRGGAPAALLAVAAAAAAAALVAAGVLVKVLAG